MTDLIFKDEVYEIVGAAMEVHRELGSGFLEAVYQETLAIEFRLRKIPFIEQPQLRLEFKGQQLSCFYKPDFLCYEELIVEIKSMRKCGRNEEAQIINALKASKKKVGLLINFGEISLFWKRFIY
jgi:GxxExxY protein